METFTPTQTENISKEFGRLKELYLYPFLGMALFGILQSNIAIFSLTDQPHYFLFNDEITTFDRIMHFFVTVFFDFKFYLIPAFLFGYGLALWIPLNIKSQKRFALSVFLYLPALFLIGLAHAIFLFHGDMLMGFAILGSLVLLCRNKSDKTLVTSAVSLIMILFLFLFCLSILQLIYINDIRDVESGETGWETIKAYTALSGSFGSVIQYNMRELLGTLFVFFIFQAPYVMSMFFFGLVAGRRQIFGRFKKYDRDSRKILLLSLCVGMSGAIFYALSISYDFETPWKTFAFAFNILSAPFLTVSITIFMAHWFFTVSGSIARHALEPVGRMFISNYILQSVICGFIFYGYGFGLIWKTTPLINFFIALGVFAIQAFLSQIWLKYFKYGFIEWVLKKATGSS
ncbi:DUF418 domain-containing protein [Xenorhabdus bovienii]|uniref:DUF418 domain-containing protein n=1 Tax=Xenorhabdus bovienii TaxID=40576 RepID=UPI00237CA4EC|nr:DUF418 domain-containing protein [Xenorhabdus bovienii]MDE1475084.1 DUF418 domain-containing protein [Xenorhabdus bovienii]MDE9432059.1 DUF418 domain-containing protein [Xenorhabdus bovienii]MDE9489785.1 DUF418 domain-containing protein [Xenorhabdus bovienii]MDE9506059.1 DUF418 domain-containing protein [Xenorhabdus bovienii]MDE9546668.1 DUF418 domain-containing protein [Xenorhabdus bovienii]